MFTSLFNPEDEVGGARSSSIDPRIDPAAAVFSSLVFNPSSLGRLYRLTGDVTDVSALACLSLTGFDRKHVID